jgi:hypothetical protein
VELAVSAPVDCVPFTALAPDQAPEAMQAVASAEDQVRVALAPLSMALGPTLSRTVGVGDLTETVVDCCVELPEGPLQVKLYVVVAFTVPLLCVPLDALAPDQPPEAVHSVALVADHVIVVLSPTGTVLGFALMLTTGTASARDTVAD